MAPAPALHVATDSDLAARVALVGIHAPSATTSTSTLAREIDAIRALALAQGRFPAVAVTHAIAAALARGERGPLVLGWIAVLHDAVSCDRQDADAHAAYAAACSVRLVD